MNYYVRITRRTEKDLSKTLDYIEFSLKNPQAVDGLLDEVEAAMGSLDYMPERYAVAYDKFLAAWGISYIQIKKHLAFYVISKETQTVHIVRFLYGKSDWRSILRNGLITE